MRTYRRNSPQAAARIVALMLIADGHVCSSEEQVLEKLNITRELGLDPAEFTRIVQALCEDQAIAHLPSPENIHADRAAVETLVADIDDPILRDRTIRLCMAVALADNHLADGELVTLAAILNAWSPQAVHRDL
jgi:tellurite resistance protein